MILKGKHIFVVEDDRNNMAVMMTILQQAGAMVHADRWGKHTVDVIQKLDGIDLILMDLMLPRGVTGYDVFANLQKTPELCNIPTVIVSASDPVLEMRKARDMGFAGFISKPIDYRTFARLLAKVFDGQEVWADDFID